MAKSARLGVAVLGLLLCGGARADIGVLDNSMGIIGTNVNPATSKSIVENVTVSAAANSVLVVSLFDRNNVSGLKSPTNTITWTAPGYGEQTLTRIAATAYGSTSADSCIYYLFNPNPGTATITITDGSGTTQTSLYMDMQAFTLSNVDTTITPVAYTANSGGTSVSSVSLSLTNRTVANCWAVVNTACSATSGTLSVDSTSGTVNCPSSSTNTYRVAMGYVANVGWGATKVTASDTTSGRMNLAVAVFQPYFPGPAAPASVTATGQQGEIGLTWSDQSGAGASSYNVLRSSSIGGPYTVVATPASNSYNDTGVSTFVPYYYRIQSVGVAGAGPYSDIASASATGVPADPAGLAAVAYDTYVALTWSPAAGASTYNVLSSTTSGSGYTQIATGLTATNYTNNGLANGTTYYYVVQAVNGVGTSGNSAEVSATPQPLAAPTGLAAVGYGTMAGLSWNASFGATSYNVLRSTTSGSGYSQVASGLPTPYYNDTGLTTGTTYYYVVQAVDAYMTSGNSGEASATPQPLPVQTGVIAVQDGALNSGMVHVEVATTISKTVTVTPGASVLIVPFYLQYNNSGTTIPDRSPATLSWGGQSLTKAIASLNTGASSSEGVCVIYYLFNPIPGTHSISFTDTTGFTVWQLAMNAFTLNNVDTAITPTALGNQGQFVGAGGLSVNYSGVPFGAFVAAVATSRNGTTRITSTTGTTNYQYVATPATPGSSFANQNELMGGVLGLLAGSDTVTSGDGGAGTPQTLATAMFTAVVAGPSSPPTGLTATSIQMGNPQTNQVALTWTADSEATGFYISRSSVSGGPYTRIGTNDGIFNVTFTDTAVGAYTNYYYVVQGFNNGGFSAYSAEAVGSAIGNPVTPAGLAAVGYGTRAALSWNLQPSADSYNVLRSSTSGGPYTQVGTAAPGNMPYFTDTGLTTGNTYYYVVQSVNLFGTSGASAQASATPQALPGPTGQIAVQDGSLTVITNGTTSVTTPLTVTPGANVLVVALWDKNGQASDLSPSSLMWRDQTLVKMIGEYCSRETAVSALYYLADPTPGTDTITAADSAATVMAMQVYTLNNVDNTQGAWALGGAQDFNNPPWIPVTFSALPGGCFAAMSAEGGENTAGLVHLVSTSGTVTYTTKQVGGVADVGMGGVFNLAAGDATITETNSHGGVAGMLAVAVFPPLVLGPTTPINLTATGETNDIVLAWEDSSGGNATSYIVLRSLTSGAGFVPIHTNAGVANITFTDTNVINYTTYYYVVKAVNSAGPSAPTAPVSAFAVGVPPAPTGLVGHWGNNTATLTWNTAPSATSYNVLRSTTSGSGYTLLANVPTNGAPPTYVDSTAVNYTTYYYVVNAANEVGTGPNTSEVSVTPSATAATIGVWDGPSSINWSANNSVSTTFTVSPGSSVLVVALLDKNNEPSTDYSPATLSWGSQSLIKVIGQVQTRDLVVCSIYYLYNPVPGTHTITATDISAGPVTAMAMQVYTLAGVNVSQPPTGYGQPNDYTHPFSVDGGNSITLGAGTPASGFAAMIAEQGNNHLNIHIVASSGTTNYVTQENLGGASVIMGGVAGLAAGAGTIAISHDSSDGIGTDLALAVFAPAGAMPYVQPNPPTILSAATDAAGANLVVSVQSQIGYRYYLLTTPSLTPPVVWTTNGSVGGTGGIITDRVPIDKNQPALLLRYLVQ